MLHFSPRAYRHDRGRQGARDMCGHVARGGGAKECRGLVLKGGVGDDLAAGAEEAPQCVGSYSSEQPAEALVADQARHGLERGPACRVLVACCAPQRLRARLADIDGVDKEPAERARREPRREPLISRYRHPIVAAFGAVHEADKRLEGTDADAVEKELAEHAENEPTLEPADPRAPPVLGNAVRPPSVRPLGPALRQLVVKLEPNLKGGHAWEVTPQSTSGQVDTVHSQIPW